VLLVARYFRAKYADKMGRPAPQFTNALVWWLKS
jgi:hypothetical protein